MSRRTVLRAGIGGGAVLVTAVAGVGIRGGVNGVWSQGQGAPYGLWRSWKDAPGLMRLVAAGTLAANPHNLQPWSFLVGQDTIEVFADPGRAMPLSDSDGRERIAGYGCAIQNIVLAARSESLDARVTVWPDAAPEHVARIELAPGTAPTMRERELLEAIPRRHTNRGPYTAQVPDGDALRALAVGAPAGAEVVWVTEPAAIDEVGALYVEATKAIVVDAEMSIEAFSWFRNDRADIDRHRDGLTLDCQGLDGFTLFLAKMLPAQSREGGDRFWVNVTRDTHTATARAYGVIRVDDIAAPRSRLAGGRLLQHVHLAATASGLGLHHMNQVSERIARDAALRNPDRFSERWTAATGVPAGQSLLAFRVGYPQRAANASPRRDLADVAYRR